MEAWPSPKSDPSLFGVFGMCLLLAPVALLCMLLGALIGVALGLPKDAIKVTALATAAVTSLPAWVWVFHLYLRGHWRLQAE